MAGCSAYATADVEDGRIWCEVRDLEEEVDEVDLCYLLGLIWVQEVAVMDVLAPDLALADDCAM